MVTVKLNLNSVISTMGACYCTINLKIFFLMMLMSRPKFMHMKLKDLPNKFISLYNLQEKIAVTSNGFIYIKIQKGMYSLPQASILA